MNRKIKNKLQCNVIGPDHSITIYDQRSQPHQMILT